MSIKIYVKYVKNNRDFYTTKMNLPTGNLDVASAQTVVQMLAEASNEYNQTIIMVTHDKQMAEYADKLLTIVDGHVSMGVDDTIAEGNG